LPKKIQNKEKTMVIYVGNLSPNASEDNLRQTFEAFGQVSFAIISSTILKDKYSGQPIGFAFVEMLDQTEGRAAIANLNKKALLGQQMIVYEARPTNERGRPKWQSSYRG
jgi:RNA recognition motif-containing protein